MAGFPIVSLGSLVGTYDACEVLIPQFEIDEYYQGDEDKAQQSYKDRYPLANSNNYLTTFSVLPNNLNSTTGTQTTWKKSNGFYNLNDFYSELKQMLSIKSIRIDAFYVIDILDYFFVFGSTASVSSVKNSYVNLPNTTVLGNSFRLNYSLIMENMYFNFPKIKSIGNYFLCNKNSISRIYFNIENLEQLSIVGPEKGVFRGCEGTIKIYSTSDTTTLFGKLLEVKDNHETTTATLIDSGTCTISFFDVRYWSKYENQTGLDVGLLEGSNLR